MTLWGHSKHYLGVYIYIRQLIIKIMVPDFKRFQVENKTIFKIDFQSKLPWYSIDYGGINLAELFI